MHFPRAMPAHELYHCRAYTGARKAQRDQQKNMLPLSPDMRHARSGGDVEPKPTNAGRIGSRTPPGTFAALPRQRKPLPLRVRAL